MDELWMSYGRAMKEVERTVLERIQQRNLHKYRSLFI